MEGREGKERKGNETKRREGKREGRKEGRKEGMNEYICDYSIVIGS